MEPGNLVREQLKGIESTIHGGQGWKLDGVEDYSQNINPFGPPKDIADIVSKASSEVGHYPDDTHATLKNVISNRFSIDEDSIIIGAGSSDIIRMFPNTFLGKGDKVIIQSPTFAEYSHQCAISGAKVKFNKLNDEFRIDFEKLKSISNGVKAVYICNPNNPTGTLEKREDIVDYLEFCEDKGIIVFVDETLLELVSDYEKYSCVNDVPMHSNIIVVHSLTKSFAIPGIRIGYGFGSPDIIAELEKVRMPWNVGCIEQAVAKKLINKRMDYVRKAADLMNKESDWMFRKLSDIDFPVKKTDSFFFFNSLEPIGMKGSEFVKKMLKQNIMVRDCSSFGKEYNNYVRFCVKDRNRNKKFVAAVRKVL